MSAYAEPDPAYALEPTGNLRRRMRINQTVVAATVVAAVIAVGMLLFLIFTIASKGLGAVSLTFLTANLPAFGAPGGGIGPALIGTLELAAIAILIAMPIGVLVALYLVEYGAGRPARVIQTVIDLLNGLPTIVAGVFVYGLIVVPYGRSGLSASIALAIVVTPLVTRSCYEAIGRVPSTYREASEALGVQRWRMIVGLVLPTAAGGIVTAAILAAARAAGETAPLLLTTSQFPQTIQLDPSQAVPNIPLQIFALTEGGGPEQIQQAWGAALVLIVVILIANIGARVLLRRSERKRGL